jgi:hypothetical protein
MKIVAKQIIYGCESRGDGQSPYMTRYAFPRIGPVRMCLHVFHRSDADDLHDHPWPFVSVILWRGYTEITPGTARAGCCGVVLSEWFIEPLVGMKCIHCGRAYPFFTHAEFAETRGQVLKRKRKWPGMILFRPATHRHRVELVDGKRAISLVFMGRRIREWGFFTRQGWKLWTKYFAENGC